jgi:DNA methyltransferase 1-associated protein 1
VVTDDLDAEGEDESSVQPSRATSQGATGGHKRSASVFSQGSEKSSKRLRK